MNLDVSLHDDDLADEVEMTARLMVAANESDAPLGTEAVDRLLGVVPAALPRADRPATPVLPAQRALSTIGY